MNYVLMGWRKQTTDCEVIVESYDNQSVLLECTWE